MTLKNQIKKTQKKLEELKRKTEQPPTRPKGAAEKIIRELKKRRDETIKLFKNINENLSKLDDKIGESRRVIYNYASKEPAPNPREKLERVNKDFGKIGKVVSKDKPKLRKLYMDFMGDSSNHIAEYKIAEREA